MIEKVLRFIEHTQLPVYVTPMAKGSIDENHPQFRGVFAGNSSTERVQKEIYSADLILSIGSLNSDINTGGFTYRLSKNKTIGNIYFCVRFLRTISYLEFHTCHTKIFHAIYDKVDMREFLPDVTKCWSNDIIRPYDRTAIQIRKPILDSNSQHVIMHEYFWYKLAEFIPDNSIIVAETGTAEFGKFDECVLPTLLFNEYTF